MKTPTDNNTVFFVGGADGPSASSNKTSYCTTYFLDLTTKAWTSGPNMTHCRYYHTCNLVKNPSSGNREIVVVGGLDEQRQDHCRFIQEVEVFDLDTQQWRNGTQGAFCFYPALFVLKVISVSDFAKPLARHTSLYYKDTFLIMGGDQCNGCNACTCTNCPTHDTIHQ